MKVIYVGDDKDPPAKTKMLGYEFEINIPVNISNEKHLTKFRKHPCFKVARNRKDNNIKSVKDLPDDKLKDIIVKNKISLKDNKKSTAQLAVAEFLSNQKGD